MAENGRLTVEDQLKMSWGELIASIPKRSLALVSKLIGVRGVAIALMTIGLYTGVIESWHYLAFIVVVVMGQKAIETIKK